MLLCLPQNHSSVPQAPISAPSLTLLCCSRLGHRWSPSHRSSSRLFPFFQKDTPPLFQKEKKKRLKNPKLLQNKARHSFKCKPLATNPPVLLSKPIRDVQPSPLPAEGPRMSLKAPASFPVAQHSLYLVLRSPMGCTLPAAAVSQHSELPGSYSRTLPYRITLSVQPAASCSAQAAGLSLQSCTQQQEQQ